MTKHRCIILFIVSPIINMCAAPSPESYRDFFYKKIFETAMKVQERTKNHDQKAEEFRKKSSLPQKVANVCLSVAAIVTCSDTIGIFRSTQPPQEKFKQLLLSGFNLAYFKLLQTISNHYLNDDENK